MGGPTIHGLRYTASGRGARLTSTTSDSSRTVAACSSCAATPSRLPGLLQWKARLAGSKPTPKLRSSWITWLQSHPPNAPGTVATAALAATPGTPPRLLAHRPATPTDRVASKALAGDAAPATEKDSEVGAAPPSCRSCGGPLNEPPTLPSAPRPAPDGFGRWSGCVAAACMVGALACASSCRASSGASSVARCGCSSATSCRKRRAGSRCTEGTGTAACGAEVRVAVGGRGGRGVEAGGEARDGGRLNQVWSAG